MPEQYDSFNEKTKLIETSLKYTNGDMEKAKAMASGQYLDVVVVKVKFYLPKAGKSGLFLAFFNIFDEYISYIDAAFVNNPSIYERSRVFDDWKILFGDVNAFKKGEDSAEIPGGVDSIIDQMVSRDIFPEVQNGRLDELTKSVNLMLAQVFTGEPVQCQIELEPTSSLMMDTGGVPLMTPPSAAPETAPKEKGREKVEETELERRMRLIEEEANYVIEGTSIVAPVKGKHVLEIGPGEKIMLLLPKKDAVSRKVLSVLEAVDSEGRISPIKGRVKDIVPVDKNGSVIYALVAKGVLAKIVEEENVRIRMEDTSVEVDEEKSESKIMFLVAVFLILVIIAGVILFIYM